MEIVFQSFGFNTIKFPFENSNTSVRMKKNTQKVTKIIVKFFFEKSNAGRKYVKSYANINLFQKK